MTRIPANQGEARETAIPSAKTDLETIILQTQEKPDFAALHAKNKTVAT